MDQKVVEWNATRKDGAEVPVEVSFGELTLDGGTRRTAFLRDITERRKIDRLKSELGRNSRGVAGLAGTLASALSMGAGAYLASKSEREVYESEVSRERTEIEEDPHEELLELELFYQLKGFSAEEARTMRLFYTDPNRPPPPTENVVMTAERSKQISGQVVFSGAGWYRRDYRKKDLGTILARVSRALAYTRWKTDATVTLMVEGVFKGGFGDRAGYTNFDWALDLKNFAIGSPRMAVLWMPAEQTLEDLSWFIDSFAPDVDGWVHHRSAQ